jgi:CTD kinase subunit beta
MAPAKNEATHTDAAPAATTPPGPHPSFIQVAKPYVFERTVQECLAATGVSQLREDNCRLQGVTWIDNVRKALHLYGICLFGLLFCPS